MSKKSNVHPDYYKTAGRDRPDDAARARLNRAIAAKSDTQQRPDRMAKGFYFERPEPAADSEFAEAAPGDRARKKTAARTPKRATARKGAAKKAGARKAPAARRKATPRKAASSKRKTGSAAARPAKKR